MRQHKKTTDNKASSNLNYRTKRVLIQHRHVHRNQLRNLLASEWRSDRDGCIDRASSISQVNCPMAPYPVQMNLYLEMLAIAVNVFAVQVTL